MSNSSENFFLSNNADDNFSIFNASNFTKSNDYTSNNSNNSYPNSNFCYDNSSEHNPQSSSCFKETGIIEKMLLSYGFIQCCERQARLFFHFSQYLGNIEHLKIGDPIEYETSYDRRTGKPVAINIKKIYSDDFMMKLSTTDRLTGVVTTPITPERQGRIAFESKGEFFFLPFTQKDVIENVELKARNKVSFVLETDKGGTYRATSIQLEPYDLIKIQGIITAIKDTFGFIERSDNLTKIFFHFSDCTDFKSLNIGDFVHFSVTTRKNKELAINVTKQMDTDEELSEKFYKGQIVRFNSRNNLASVFCQELNKEFFFHDKDVKGGFTIYPFDLVTFQIATDRQSNCERAINLQFEPETFLLNSEIREKGYIASLKETYGFIKCPSKEGSLIYFKHIELIDPTIVLKLNDEVEFTYLSDAQVKKCQAIRISILPNGTLFNNILSKKSSDASLVPLEYSNEMYYPVLNTLVPAYFETETTKDNQLEAGGIDSNEKIENNNENNESWTKKLLDVFQDSDIFTLSNGHADVDGLINNGSIEEIQSEKKTGVVVVLKENFGFIESFDGETEYYFQLSSYKDESKCKIGQAVEFDSIFLNDNWKAFNVVPIENFSEIHENDLSETFTGIVTQTVKIFDPEQSEYEGLIAKVPNSNYDLSDEHDVFPFGITSLKFPKDFISIGDPVRFQTATNCVSKKKRAFNVEPIRERQKGFIVSLQPLYGFIRPCKELQRVIKRNIYFNTSELHVDDKVEINDRVDFYLIYNPRTLKNYAIDIRKSEISKTEEIFSFKNKRTEISGPKVIAIRQPRAPNGSIGFIDNSIALEKPKTI
ncbi:hypothetical protein NH340_JMT01922 [Sarcoptes scabiei]|nr:hypothetical protein NH340_JMT01922 [Sarcoptes scabiei]